MGYSHKTCERLVMAADKDGSITFAQIRRVFPDHESSFFYDLIGDAFQTPYPIVMNPTRKAMLYWDKCPKEYIKGYEFKDSDRFQLSVIGLNIRDECVEQMKDRKLALIAAISGSIAAIASVVSLLR